jgi:hypothetical protein
MCDSSNRAGTRIRGVLSAITGAAMVGLCACTPIYFGPTGYTAANPDWGNPYGYSDKRIDDDEWSIVGKGNAKTSQERIAEIALLRAAHLTLDQGGTRFLVVNDKSEIQSGSQVVWVPLAPGLIVPVGSMPTREPISVLLIRIPPSGYSAPPGALDASEVIARLSPRLGQE